ncbi:MAG: hypothetical protein JEZ06_07750 [Anaerolineaceae bacterium]|nr:hypothetical protein [Anaerolineaceae bacterium]
MPRIRCQYDDCQFIEENYCSAARVELDVDKGCLTYFPNYKENDSDLDVADVDELEKWDDWEEDPEEEIMVDDDEW